MKIISQNTDPIYKRSKPIYLKNLACKSQEFLGNKHHRGTAFTFAPGFVASSTINNIVTTSLLLARSLTEFHKQLELLFFSVQSRLYGYKPNFLKLVSLSISDSVPDEDRDLLEDILPNEMIRKLNLILGL